MNYACHRIAIKYLRVTAFHFITQNVSKMGLFKKEMLWLYSVCGEYVIYGSDIITHRIDLCISIFWVVLLIGCRLWGLLGLHLGLFVLFFDIDCFVFLQRRWMVGSIVLNEFIQKIFSTEHLQMYKLTHINSSLNAVTLKHCSNVTVYCWFVRYLTIYLSRPFWFGFSLCRSWFLWMKNTAEKCSCIKYIKKRHSPYLRHCSTEIK